MLHICVYGYICILFPYMHKCESRSIVPLDILLDYSKYYKGIFTSIVLNATIAIWLLIDLSKVSLTKLEGLSLYLSICGSETLYIGISDVVLLKEAPTRTPYVSFMYASLTIVLHVEW